MKTIIRLIQVLVQVIFTISVLAIEDGAATDAISTHSLFKVSSFDDIETNGTFCINAKPATTTPDTCYVISMTTPLELLTQDNVGPLSERRKSLLRDKFSSLVINYYGFKEQMADKPNSQPFILELFWVGKPWGMLGLPAEKGSLIIEGTIETSQKVPTLLQTIIDNYYDRVFADSLSRTTLFGGLALDRVELETHNILNSILTPAVKHLMELEIEADIQLD